ncbi:hypothetical protein EDD11_002395 [Mortierella claussenii]|nr:hypothetical protein EDD11_002395 [Mortierella claussenii]
MENWGLIMFRTYAVLLDEYGTNDRKRDIAGTVIHEISHQWFGNLVTMDWWSDLWLFEGFATHLAYIVMDELFPSWDIWSEFVKRIQEVLKHDALRTSHPVEVGVANPSEITQIFDEVSYMKGASVLRMLSAWLGQDQLLKGVRKFMLKYMWGNANTEDLWMTLAEECQVDVPGFMRNWTRQTGYPVLTITELDQSTILIRQSLFLSTGDVRPEEDTLLWPVPLSVATADDPTPRNIMMDTKEMILQLDTTRWYKFNMGQTGFYRVAYPSKTLDLLGQTLGNQENKEREDKDRTLDAANRIGLLTDAAALVASGHTPTSSFLTLLKYFEDEESYMVWVEISYRLQELFSVWLEQPAPIMSALKEVQRRLFTKIVKRLGWEYPEEEDPATGNLRALAIRYAGRAGDLERRFSIFMNHQDMSAIPPDLRFPVFEIVLRTTSGVEEYEAIVHYYRETYMPGEKVVALTVLGYGHSLELIHRTLAFAMSTEVRTQDILTAIMTLRSSVQGRAALWNFMRQHWDVLYERHCDDIRFLDYFVLLSIGSFSSLERYQEVQEFFENKDTSSYERILATCLEGIRMHILWLERDRQDVESWLRTHGYLTAEMEQLDPVATAATTTTTIITPTLATASETTENNHPNHPWQQPQQSAITDRINGRLLQGGHHPMLRDSQEYMLLAHVDRGSSCNRSRSSSSVDGFSSTTETYLTPGSTSSATSSCSSSPPDQVYTQQQQHHLGHPPQHHHQRHQNHHHRHQQHHSHDHGHGHQHRHHGYGYEQEMYLQQSGYDDQTHQSICTNDSHLLTEDQVRWLQLQQQQQQHPKEQQQHTMKQGRVLGSTHELELGATVQQQMNELMMFSAAAAAATTTAAAAVTATPRTLEGDMEMLRLHGESEF